MATIYGIDGCPDGWLVLQLRDTAVTGEIFKSLTRFSEELLDSSDVVAIDVPIGLPDRNHPVRECDRLARKVLGRRHVCVFSPPCRLALNANDRPSASVVNKEVAGRRVTCQAWGIGDKLIEMDDFLRHRKCPKPAFYEAHPEVSFAHWRMDLGCVDSPIPFQTTKKRMSGRIDRKKLIETQWPGAIDRISKELEKCRWAQDDLIDAFACLWTARRIENGDAVSYPKAPFDQTCFPMQIHA